MKAQDIILQLMRRLPVVSPFFAQRVPVVGISKVLSEAEALTQLPHNLVVGSIVTMHGVRNPVGIASYTQTATQIEIVTLTNHDFTLNDSAPLDQGQLVKIMSLHGYNYDFVLIEVPNRKRLIVRKDSQPAFPSESLYVQEVFNYGYNGLKQVTAVPTTTSFRYAVDFDLAEPNQIVDAFLSTNIRVSGAADLVTLVNSYTAQPPDNVWACVVLEDNVANKDRRTMNDAMTQQGRQMDFSQQIISNFTVYIIIPNKGDILTETNGRAARDLIEDIRVPLFKSLLGIEFRTELAAQGQSCVTYTGDGFVSFNSAIYVHQFSFQQVMMVTSSDTAIETFDRAFRDIDLSIRNQFSYLTAYTASINLDDILET